jgi:WD40 repeat protein
MSRSTPLPALPAPEQPPKRAARITDWLAQRNAGAFTPATEQDRVTASPAFVHRFRLRENLTAHDGCVNTVVWTPDGESAITGSDDCKIALWSMRKSGGKSVPMCRFNSLHTNNIFSAKLLGARLEDGSRLVSCAADGQVRMHQLKPGGKIGSRRVYTHEGRAHKLSISPTAPDAVFASTGEDGRVCVFDARLPPGSMQTLGLTLRKRTFARLSLNIGEFHPQSEHYILVAGSDPVARVFDLRKPAEAALSFAPSHLLPTKCEGATVSSDPSTSHQLETGASSQETRDVACETEVAASSAATPARSSPASSRANVGETAATETGASQRVSSRLPSAWMKPAVQAHITGAQWSWDGSEIVATYNDEHIYLFDAASTRRQSFNTDLTHPLRVVATTAPLSEPPSTAASSPCVPTFLGGEAGSDVHERPGMMLGAAQAWKDADGAPWIVQSAPLDLPGPNRFDDFLAHHTWSEGANEDADRAPDAASNTSYARQYRGHRNEQTVKGVAFMGPRSEYIVSGCDTGHIFVWDKATGGLVNAWKGDRRGAVNCLSPHPLDVPVLLTSGLSHFACVWEPLGEGPSMAQDAIDRLVRKNAEDRESDTSSGGFQFMSSALLRRLLMSGLLGGMSVDGEEDDDDALDSALDAAGDDGDDSDESADDHKSAEEESGSEDTLATDDEDDGPGGSSSSQDESDGSDETGDARESASTSDSSVDGSSSGGGNTAAAAAARAADAVVEEDVAALPMSRRLVRRASAIASDTGEGAAAAPAATARSAHRFDFTPQALSAGPSGVGDPAAAPAPAGAASAPRGRPT